MSTSKSGFKVDDSLVETIESTIHEEFPDLENSHEVAVSAAKATVTHHLEHINDCSGMTWIEDPEDDTIPGELRDD